MTATPNIAPATASDKTAGSRAPSKTASGSDATFAHLLSHDDADEAAAQNSKTADIKKSAGGKTRPADAKPADAKPVDAKTDGGVPAKATPPATIDQAVTAQLKALLAKSGETDGDDPDADIAGTADKTADTKPKSGKGHGKTKDPDAVALAVNLAPQPFARSATGDVTGKIGSGAKTIQPVTPQEAADAASKTAAATSDGDKKIDGENVKALATAATKQPAEPAPGAAAKAMPAHLAASNAKGGSNPQAGGEHKQKQDDRTNTQTAAANAPADSQAKPAPVAAATPSAPAPAPHVATQAASPAAPDAVLANAAQPAAPATAHPVTASLNVTANRGDATTPDVAALAVNITAKSKDGEKHFDIRLDPAELGRVEVRLSIDDAGKTQASLSAERPQTLELLQRDRSTLERALRDAGLDLAGGGLNFSLKGQDREAGNTFTPRSRGRSLSVSAIAATGSVASAQSLSNIASANSRLDIRV